MSIHWDLHNIKTFVINYSSLNVKLTFKIKMKVFHTVHKISNFLKHSCSCMLSNKNFIPIHLNNLVCLEFFVPLKNFSLIWRHHHYQWRAANFDLCSALMAIEQWGFFNVPHLLRHGPTVYNGHPWGPVTLTPVAECLAVELSLAVLIT